MFKKKFLEFAKSQDTKEGSFEVLNESQTLSIMGGCGLNRCREFYGSCSDLRRCGVFLEEQL